MPSLLEECVFKSVLSLRKVCHSLRNFVDDAHFKTDLKDVKIILGPPHSVICRRTDLRSTIGFGLAKDWTSNDLKINLKLLENTKLSSFVVISNPDNVGGLDELEEILKNRTRPLQTEYFEMKGSEILKVMPYLDSNTLKKITIMPTNFEADDQHFDSTEEFLKLEQFRNAVELTIDFRFLVRADVRKFFHLQELFVRLHETSLEDLVALKEAFVTSTYMEHFDLGPLELNENQLEQVFGTPFHEPRYPRGPQWFFKIQKCKEHVLRIEWDLGGLTFRKLEAEGVPQDAVVQH